MTCSFPLTAAGQSRFHTGFPLATPVTQANRRSEKHSTSCPTNVSRQAYHDATAPAAAIDAASPAVVINVNARRASAAVASGGSRESPIQLSVTIAPFLQM